eukprot:4238046-Amphidinium_carterae.1
MLFIKACANSVARLRMTKCINNGYKNESVREAFVIMFAAMVLQKAGKSTVDRDCKLRSALLCSFGTFRERCLAQGSEAAHAAVEEADVHLRWTRGG